MDGCGFAGFGCACYRLWLVVMLQNVDVLMT
jgi:hypothetical protein